jgi:hypothetical protein
MATSSGEAVRENVPQESVFTDKEDEEKIASNLMICASFLSKGSCVYGSYCDFSHSLPQKNPSPEKKSAVAKTIPTNANLKCISISGVEKQGPSKMTGEVESKRKQAEHSGAKKESGAKKAKVYNCDWPGAPKSKPTEKRSGPVPIDEVILWPKGCSKEEQQIPVLDYDANSIVTHVCRVKFLERFVKAQVQHGIEWYRACLEGISVEERLHNKFKKSPDDYIWKSIEILKVYEDDSDDDSNED